MEKLSAKDKEVTRINEQNDSSEQKLKHELAQARVRYDAEHAKRLQQEQEIRDSWSTKVEKRNAKIRVLTDENDKLKEQVGALSVSMPSPQKLPAEPENQPATAALQKDTIKLNKGINYGAERFKTVKDEKTTVAAENTSLAAQIAEKEKVILSLRSSEELVKDRIEKAVTHALVQKEDECAAIISENEKMRGSEDELFNRIQVLEAQVSELRRQRERV